MKKHKQSVWRELCEVNFIFLMIIVILKICVQLYYIRDKTNKK